MSRPCEHLKNLTKDSFPPPRTQNLCEECIKEGTTWVSLRECLTCGHVGCCDFRRPGRQRHKTLPRYAALGHALDHARRPMDLVLCP